MARAPFFKKTRTDQKIQTQTERKTTPMKQIQETLRVATRGQGPMDITSQVEGVVRKAGVELGLCVVFVQHTSASLVIQENADPSARRDVQDFLERLAPEGDPHYTHTAEGPDDMPSHLRSVVTNTSLSIPVAGGGPVLGTWQGIYLWEHRRRDHRRRVVVHVMGE